MHPIADRERKTKENKGYVWSIYVRDWEPTWNDRPPMSDATAKRMREIWENDTEDEYLRKIAFSFWLTRTQASDLKDLQCIAKDSPLYHFAIEKRIDLNDKTVDKDLLILLKDKNNYYLIEKMNKIWSEKIFQVVMKYLKTLKKSTPTDYTGGYTNNHFQLARLIVKLEPNIAEAFLIKNWSHLQFSGLFITAALYHGMTVTEEMVREALKFWKKDASPFKYVSHIFGFYYKFEMNLITLKHIESLLPHLKWLESQEIDNIANICARLSILDIVENEIKNKISKDSQKIHYPDDNVLFSELDEMIVQNSIHRIGYWAEKLEERHSYKGQTLHVLRSWLERRKDFAGLQIVAEYISNMGTRSDLEVLNIPLSSQEEVHADRVRRDTKYWVYKRTLDSK
jgi:hypothetical protein